jgi:hypothetical protein
MPEPAQADALPSPFPPSCARQGDVCSGRLSPRSRCGESGQSAFTSYIARKDLATAISKYRTSACQDAYYLLTEVRGGGWAGGGWAWAGSRGALGRVRGRCDRSVGAGGSFSCPPPPKPTWPAP